MNKFTIVPNRIKQPAICCVYCGKGYKSRTGYEKHAILCELIDRTKKKKKLRILDDVDEVMPSNRQMYQMLLELSQKYINLEKKMDEMSKFVVKQKKKIKKQRIELNGQREPSAIRFDELLEKYTELDSVLKFENRSNGFSSNGSNQVHVSGGLMNFVIVMLNSQSRANYEPEWVIHLIKIG